MKNYIKYNLITLLIVSIIVLVFESIVLIPWWIFIIPVVLLGSILSHFQCKINSFPIGFITGFLIWSSMNYFLSLSGNGIVLTKIGLLLSSSTLIVILISGIIGGILVGLALYVGTNIISNNRNIEVEAKKS